MARFRNFGSDRVNMRHASFSRALSIMVDSTASDLIKVNDRVWTSQASPYSISSHVSNWAKDLARVALAVIPVASETRKISFKPTWTPVGGAQDVSSSSVYKMAGEAMVGMCALLSSSASSLSSSPFTEYKGRVVVVAVAVAVVVAVVVLVVSAGAVKLKEAGMLTATRNSKEEVQVASPLMLEESLWKNYKRKESLGWDDGMGRNNVS
mmetsp:Transcript_18962/g.34402  ORF Transcript_18962/g.34402 Transcript_18962/m.34402 type:complete len:209 (-) Transcript_18962:377-1003(-)